MSADPIPPAGIPPEILKLLVPSRTNFESWLQSAEWRKWRDAFRAESVSTINEDYGKDVIGENPQIEKDFNAALESALDKLLHIKKALHVTSEYGDSRLKIALRGLEKAHEAFLPSTLNKFLYLREARLQAVCEALDKVAQDLENKIEIERKGKARKDKARKDQGKEDTALKKLESLLRKTKASLDSAQFKLDKLDSKFRRVLEEESEHERKNVASGGVEKPNATPRHKAPEDINFARLFHKMHTTEMYAQLEEIEEILEEGLNSTDDNWSTPLHKAAENNYFECVEDLIEAGANISARDKEGQTALHLAAKNGCIDCVKLLMKAGSEWDEVHKEHRAERGKHGWPLYHNIIDYEGNTALHLAVNWKGAKLSKKQEPLDLITLPQERLRLSKESHQSELELDDEVELQGVDNLWLPGKIVRVGNDEDPFGKCYKVECDKGRELLKILLESDKTDPEAIKEHKSAMDKRNYDGCTPCVIAALKGFDDYMAYLIKVHDAKFKEGQLHHNDRENRFKIFLGASSLFGLALGIWLMVYFLFDRTIINTHNHRCHYYYKDNEDRGILLEPNLSLVLSVFVFKFIESIFVAHFLPACHFVQHYIRDRFFWWCGPSSNWTCCPCPKDGPKKHQKCCSRGERRQVGNLCCWGCFRKPESWWGLLEPEYWWCELFDPNDTFLHSWRIQKYTSLRFSHERYAGYEFSFQTEMIWYYLQVLYAFYDFVVIFREVFGTEAFAGFTHLQIYVRFYGRVVNSSCLSAAFSLFKLLVFGRRQSQFLHACSIFGSWLGPFWGSRVVGPFWLFCVTFPAIVLIPPLFSHVPPGVVLFPWLWICVLVSYWVIGIEGYKWLFPKSEGELDEWLDKVHKKHKERVEKEVKHSTGDDEENTNDSCCISCSYRCCRNLCSCNDDEGDAERLTVDHSSKSYLSEDAHSSKKKGSSKKDDTRRSQHVVTDAELGKYHLRRLEDRCLMLSRHLYWMLLTILARFAFLIFFQVLYDYVSLSVYSGEHRPFSAMYLDAYKTAFGLRSQTRCYITSLQELMRKNALNFLRVPVGSALSSTDL